MYQQQRYISDGPYSRRCGVYNLGLQMGQRRSVAASDDTWRIEMKCAFPDPRQLCVVVLVLYYGILGYVIFMH